MRSGSLPELAPESLMSFPESLFRRFVIPIPSASAMLHDISGDSYRTAGMSHVGPKSADIPMSPVVGDPRSVFFACDHVCLAVLNRALAKFRLAFNPGNRERANPLDGCGRRRSVFERLVGLASLTKYRRGSLAARPGTPRYPRAGRSRHGCNPRSRARPRSRCGCRARAWRPGPRRRPSAAGPRRSW